jgi:hypothetical protein
LKQSPSCHSFFIKKYPILDIFVLPFLRWFGVECDYYAMVMDLLGRKYIDAFISIIM